jgi:hypothetical protein
MSKAREHEALIQAGEAREAGVAELLTFYARIEEVYAAASKAFREEQPTVTTNSTNPSRASR